MKIDNEGNIKLVLIDEMSILGKALLLKIDTEGFEENAIKGAINLINRDILYIIVERQGESIIHIIGLV